MPDDARPFSNCLLDLAPPDIALVSRAIGHRPGADRSCEQHGAHLPLGTDTITALEVARRAAEKAEVPYAPPLWAGYSPQHMREPESGVGTITLRPDTFTELLYDIARSLIHHGWNKLVFVNGHGSNTKVIDPLLRRIGTRPARSWRSTSRTPSATSACSTTCSRTRPTRRPAGTRRSSRRRR